jgi:hypothetical protein
VQDRLRVVEEAEHVRADQQAGREIAEHRAEADPAEERHGDRGCTEQDETGSSVPVTPSTAIAILRRPFGWQPSATRGAGRWFLRSGPRGSGLDDALEELELRRAEVHRAAVAGRGVGVAEVLGFRPGLEGGAVAPHRVGDVEAVVLGGGPLSSLKATKPSTWP